MLTGLPIAPLAPGSPEWLKTISASKVPAILGISPWQSKYALWHLMAGNTAPWGGNKSTERGTFLEAAVLNWFKTKHEGDWVHSGRSFAHSNYNEWTAAPDAWCEDDAQNIYGVEVKTSQYSDGWGKAGTAEIPPYYLAQALWQIVVCGFDTVYVPVLFGQPFEFREYVVRHVDVVADIPTVIRAVKEFQTSLREGIQPDIDGSSATYNTIKELHPEIDGEVVEVPELLGYSFLDAKRFADETQAEADSLKNQIAAYMGTAKKAVWNGQPLFTRQSKSGGTPYMVIARTLPELTTKDIAA